MMIMNDRAGRWVRVSGDSQSEADQLPDIDSYCDDRGYIKGKPYEVHGKSAYKGAQDPYWLKVVKDVQDGVIDVVVCWMVDRLDRQNILHAIPMVLAVLDAGGRVEFSEQPECNLDAKSPTIDDEVKAFSDRIHAANQESKIKSKRVLKAQRRRREAGSAVGRAAWGYTIICDVCKKAPSKPGCKDHKKVFVPTANGRKYIPLIFARVIGGESMRKIAVWLTAEGVPTTNGKPWNEGYLATRLIKNPIYYGERRNAGQLETEALISASTWQQANAAVKSRVRPGRATSAREKAMLAPICGECKGVVRDGCPDGRSPIYRVYGGNGENRQPYYRCTGHGPQRKGCGFMIAVAKADAMAINDRMQDEHWHKERVFVAGDDLSDRIIKLREKAMDAYRDNDKVRFRELDAQADELEDLNKTRKKPGYEYIDTYESEGDYFAALNPDQQREYFASKEVILSRDGVEIQEPELPERKDPWL
jgi:DNA invertase Pin-like site-specific DNA recombinase